MSSFPLLKETALITSSISCFLLLFPIITYSFHRLKFPTRLPLYLCFAVFGLEICIFAGALNERVCYEQAIGIQYFSFAAILFWFIVALNFYLVLFGMPFENLERIYLLVGWFVPMVFTVVPIFLDLYVTENDFKKKSDNEDMKVTMATYGYPWECWLKNRNPVWPTYFFLYGWMGLISLCGIFLWYHILIRIYRIHATTLLYEEEVPQYTNFVDELNSNPFIPNSCNIVPSSIRCQESSRVSDVTFWSYFRHLVLITTFLLTFIGLTTIHILNDFDVWNVTMGIIHTLLISSLGIQLAVIFGFTNQNIQRWKSYFLG